MAKSKKNLPFYCAVMTRKGGAGKTTTSVNLASVSAKRGYKTLLLDADPQGSAAIWYEDRANFGLPAEIDNLTVQRWTGKNGDLPAIIRGSDFDSVIIDTPPRADVDTLFSRALLASIEGGSVVVPMKPAKPDLDASLPTIKLVQEAAAGFPISYGVLLNAVKARASMTNQIKDAIIELGLNRYRAGLFDWTAYTDALSSSMTIYEAVRASGREIEAVEKMFDAVFEKNIETAIDRRKKS